MHDQVRGAAQIVAADLAAAQSLAVTNNTSYQITFDRGRNLYYLEHSGASSAFDTLPTSAFGRPDDPDTRRTTDFARLPFSAVTVRLHIVQEQPAGTSNPAEVTTLEFGPLGETTRTNETRIWLAAGRDSTTRYLPLTVDPITGIATIGEYQSEDPSLAEDPTGSDPSLADGASGEEYDYDYGTGGSGSGSEESPSESSGGDGTGSSDEGTGSPESDGGSDGYMGDGSE